MIATLPRDILIPRRVEFPAWVRKIGDPLKMFGHGAFGKPFAQPMGGAGVAAVPLLYDQFTGTDGAAVNGRTPDTNGSGTWTAPAGVTIQSNKARAVNTGFLGAVYDVGQSDVTITFTVNITAGTNAAALLLRYTDNNNHLLCAFYLVTEINLYTRIAGSYTSLGKTTWAIPAGTDLDCTMTLSGTSIDINLAGHTLSKTSSFNQSATKFGIGSNGGTATYDNYKVMAL